jgi:uncharacterized protein with PIN domain
MKLLCDDNLGKLAKYLRMLGFDTFFKIDIADSELLAVMLKEGRIVLTRDHNLIRRIETDRYLIIESDEPEVQLEQVIDQLKLQIEKGKLFSRCLECNEVCENVDAEEVKDQVFPYVIKTQTIFKRCPSCQKIYWRGSHYRDMTDKLAEIIGEI